MSTRSSHHILNTAANLLGFCLFVITSLHITDKSENSIPDEATGVIALLLTVSCVLSFMAIKTAYESRERKLERIAEYFFISALIGILIVIILMMTALFKHEYAQ